MTERWEITTVGAWSGQETAVECKLFRNDFQIYRFTAVNMAYAILRMSAVYLKILNFPIAINNRADVNEKIVGRSVYYREMPALVTMFDGERGMVSLRADGPITRTTGAFLPEPWDDSGAHAPGDIWEDLLSPNIHWSREEQL